MNWRAEAVERLESHMALRQSLRTLPQELKRLEMEATALRSGTMTGIGERSDRGAQEDLLLNNMVKRQELTMALEQARLHTALTDQALACLSQEEGRLLELCYIKPRWGNVNQLCIELGFAKATLYRKRDEALKKFTLALFGRT